MTERHTEVANGPAIAFGEKFGLKELSNCLPIYVQILTLQDNALNGVQRLFLVK